MPTNDEIKALMAELRSAAGVGFSVETLEVFLLFPDEFRRKYTELCSRALRGALEGSGGQEKAGEVGLARRKASTRRGGSIGGVQGGGKRYRQHWTVKDEIALDVKTKVDRRLRALARELTAMLEARTEMRVYDEQVTTSGRCSCCGRYMTRGWYYCPTCGAEVRYDSNGGDSEGG